MRGTHSKKRRSQQEPAVFKPWATRQAATLRQEARRAREQFDQEPSYPPRSYFPLPGGRNPKPLPWETR